MAETRTYPNPPIIDEVYRDLIRGRPDFKTTLKEINSLRSLDPDWDGEGGVPISDRIANLAADAVELGVEHAAQTEARWLPPSVSPTPEGGIDLSWRVDGRRALLILQPDCEGVVCVIKTGNEEPQRHILSLRDAVVAVMSLLNA